jgi:hypothetical protein
MSIVMFFRKRTQGLVGAHKTLRMVEDQASNLYASDTDTWSATSSVQGSGKEAAVSSHSPLDLTVVRSHPSQ